VVMEDARSGGSLSREEAWGAARRALAGAPLFADLEPALLDRIVARSRPVSLAAGEWLMHQGDVGDAAYAICTGRLQVVVEHPEPARVVDEHGYGDLLGELALLTGLPRSASVRAVRDSELLAIDRTEFTALLTGQGFARALLHRLGELVLRREDDAAPAVTRPRVLALIRAGGPLPWDRLVEETWRAASGLGTTALLRGGDALEEYGHVLDRLEAQNDLVLLVCADPDGQPGWRAFCVRQADRVVVLAGCAGRPEAMPDGCDVVLVREHPGMSVGPWLDASRPRAHHVLDCDDRLGEGVARTVRRILGRSHLGEPLENGADGQTADGQAQPDGKAAAAPVAPARSPVAAE